MKILLAHKFHRLTGGAEVFYFEVARVLKENGHEVAFFTTKDSDNINTGDKTFIVKSPDYTNGSIVSKLVGTKDIFYSQDKKNAFKDALKDFEPDIIHVFAIHVHLTPSILEAAKESSIPVVMSCNDYKHICPNYKLYDGSDLCEACKGFKFYNAVIKKCCKGSLVFSVASTVEAYIHEYKKVYDKYVDRYLFASEFMLNKTKEFWPEKDVHYGVLKNPFDTSKYEPVYQGDYALYFGRIIDEKGVDRIIDAAKHIEIPIKIIGDGPGLAALQLEVEKYELNHIEFLGTMWGDDLNKILYKARFVIVPSLWHENFPYVIFQAFASGKPVIGSIRGGIPELIGKERGLLFEPDNEEELADCMEKLWNNVEGCQLMGKSAREYVLEEFSEDVFLYCTYVKLSGGYAVNVLVLGGHGFIGSHIVEALIGEGHIVRVFARNYADFYSNAEWFVGDFFDKGKLAESLVGMDAVVHCISTTVPATSASNPIYDIESNLVGTVELLQLLQEQGISRFVYLSSGGTVYGNPRSNPVFETDLLSPISSYGAVKVAIEKFIEVSKINWGIQPVILRPSNPFGERQGHKGVQGLISTVFNNIISNKTTLIYGDGSAIRDYIYVKDVAQLVCMVLGTERCGIYNAGSGQGYSINQVIETIENTTGLNVLRSYTESRGFDVREIVLDNTLAEKHFGWKASTSLASGIQKQFDSINNKF